MRIKKAMISRKLENNADLAAIPEGKYNINPVTKKIIKEQRLFCKWKVQIVQENICGTQDRRYHAN